MTAAKRRSRFIELLYCYPPFFFGGGGGGTTVYVLFLPGVPTGVRGALGALGVLGGVLSAII